MIVQIVLVIVTAVQVNSQELCASVCQFNGDNVTCANLFCDVKNMTQHRFHFGLRVLRVTGRTNLEREEDLFLLWNITSLTSLDLSRNNIRKIWQRAFYSLADLQTLNLYGNSITTLDSKTFYNNTRLVSLSLSMNSITDIHPSTFQKNVRLNEIYMSENKITSLDPDLFMNSVELKKVHVYNNRIIDVNPSIFRNNSRLRYLDISGNQITVIHPSMFIHNKELKYLTLQGNNIREINNTLFRGLEQLEDLNLSNNKIGELNPDVFHNTITSTNRHFQKVSKLKRINLAQNMIRSFKFELYFSISNNSDSPNPTFQLDYLNLSSNRLTTLDVASMKWLNHTTAVTDLTANPWNCDCSVLLEVWRGLKHKLTLHCASPEQLQGKSWDVMQEFCSLVAEDKNKKSNTISEAVSPSTESEVSDNVGDLSVLTTTLIVSGVLLVCAVCGGIILVKVVKRRRNRQKTPEYCDIYPPRASYISINSYAEVGAESCNVSVHSYTDVDSDRRNATG